MSNKIISESCYMINRACDYVCLHTNRQNRQSLNMIRKNLASIYEAVRDLENENLKLKESREKDKRELYAKITKQREQIISLGGNAESDYIDFALMTGDYSDSFKETINA